MPARNPRELFSIHETMRTLRPPRPSNTRKIVLSLLASVFAVPLSLAVIWISLSAKDHIVGTRPNLAASAYALPQHRENTRENHATPFSDVKSADFIPPSPSVDGLSARSRADLLSSIAPIAPDGAMTATSTLAVSYESPSSDGLAASSLAASPASLDQLPHRTPQPLALSIENERSIDEKLAALAAALRAEWARQPALTLSGPAAYTPISTAAFAQSQKIDNLSGTSLSNITISGVAGLTDADIPDSLTASNYLPLTGGTLTGDLSMSGTLTAGALSVAAVSSGGAVIAPYFTATSTTEASDLQNLTATNATTTSLFVNSAFSSLQATIGSLAVNSSISSPLASFGTLTATSSLAVLGTLSSPNATIGALTATSTLAVLGTLSSPQATIGSLQATSSLALSSLPWSLLSTDGSGTIVATSSPTAAYFTATSTAATSTFAGGLTAGELTVDLSTGYVGVGTTTPSHIFSVLGDSYIKGNLQVNGNTTISDSGQLTVGDKVISEGEIGVGTTSPYAKLAVQGTSVATTSFAVWGFGGQTAPLLDVFDGAGSNLLRVTSGGNVGIGTAAPGYALDVRRTISTGANGGNDGAIRLDDSDSGAWFWIDNPSSSQYMRFSSGATPGTGSMVLTSTGNVGIGTTSPTTELHIVGDESETSTTFESLLTFGQSGGNNAFAQFYRDYNGSQNYLGLESFSNSNAFTKTPLVFQEFGGNVGIGDTSPSGVLQIQRTHGSGTTQEMFRANYDDNWGLRLVQNYVGAGDIKYEWKQEYSGTEHDVLTFKAGNVGIGTTSPTHNLTVSDATAPHIKLEKSGASAKDWYIANSTAAAQTFTISDESAYHFAITNSGNIGIGTTTPTAKLTIVGLSESASGVRPLCYNTSTGAVTYDDATSCTASSARFKHDITSLSATSSLTEIMRLRPVSFVFNADIYPNDQSTHVGFIAEEVHEVDPRITAYEADDVTPRGVKYSNITALLAGAIQAQQWQLDTLIGSTTPAEGEEGSFVSRFFANLYERLVAWFANAANGIGDFFANRVRTREICVGKTCIAERDLQELLALKNTQAAMVSGISANIGSSNLPTSETPTSPVIEVQGNNPAVIAVGDAYNDLGARITGPTPTDTNLGIKTFLNGALVSNIVLDTTAPATNTIDYVASNAAGTSTSTRTVIIEVPDQPEHAAETQPTQPTPPPAATSTATTTATSTPAQ